MSCRPNYDTVYHGVCYVVHASLCNRGKSGRERRVERGSFDMPCYRLDGEILIVRDSNLYPVHTCRDTKQARVGPQSHVPVATRHASRNTKITQTRESPARTARLTTIQECTAPRTGGAKGTISHLHPSRVVQRLRGERGGSISMPLSRCALSLFVWAGPTPGPHGTPAHTAHATFTNTEHTRRWHA